jgi:hypothetical protein
MASGTSVRRSSAVADFRVVVDDRPYEVADACKYPCHRRSVGNETRSISRDCPHYLVLKRGHQPYLNIIDPPLPLFMMPTFAAFLRFVDREIKERDVLIHCNQGESRAPSLALLYMAKRLSALPNDSYNMAATEFRRRFPYNPGRGIATWLTKNWTNIA